ncbi:MAG: glucuronate isomerase [Cyclobacteriaceae bacterium]
MIEYYAKPEHVHPLRLSLTNVPASRILHQYAAELPVIDYHGHLSPAAIADNTMFLADFTQRLAGR